jgi:serine phosphatase RsbU (regulator of sigma subunit)
MHRLLEECLPDGVYVECTLARLGPDGAVAISPAGGSRVLLRRGGRVELVRLRGGWLGLLPPSAGDQHAVTLAAGDELLLGTDGFFDQLAALGEPVPAELQQLSTFRPLFDHARDLLQRALKATPQIDDITLVLLRRRGEDERAVLPFLGPAGRNGGGHVPM